MFVHLLIQRPKLVNVPVLLTCGLQMHCGYSLTLVPLLTTSMARLPQQPTPPALLPLTKLLPNNIGVYGEPYVLPKLVLLA